MRSRAPEPPHRCKNHPATALVFDITGAMVILGIGMAL